VILFLNVWTVDFEFRAEPGEHPFVVCLVARNFNTGQEIRLLRDQLLARVSAPFDTDPHSVLVTWYGSAEIGCFFELGWRPPDNIIDLYAEHRVLTNGLILPKYKSRKKETTPGKSFKSSG
jgi:DNA polymerase I